MVSKITTPITPLEQTEKINEIIDNLGIGGFNILEHKWSDHLLNDQSWLRADTFSWQDGTVYSNAYDHLVDDLSTATQKTDGLVEWTQPVLTGATTSTDLGNVVVTCSSNYSGYDAYKAMDGVKSGTTADSGWGTNNSTSGWWQVKFPYKLLITGLKGYQRYDEIPANANTVGRFYTSSTKETPIGNEYSNATSTNWNAVEVTGIPAGGIITDTIYFEKTGGGGWGGLGELEITARRLTSNYPITYYEAQDGHKICLPDQETTVSNIYNESGVAWYYVLDTTNQRFKLPRENPAREELIQKADVVWGDKSGGTYSVAIGKKAGLGNINTGGVLANTASSAVYYPSDSSYNQNFVYSGSGDLVTDLSSGSGVYKGKQYLYFYVGQFSQTATEQTAGLNSELFNGKVDLNAQNLSTQGKSLISGLGMPSGRYDDLTLGAHGTEYTAPANGYFCLMKNSNAGGQNIALNNNTNPGLSSFATNNATTQALRCFIPARKNDIVAVGYTAGGAVQWFRFYYAEGEENV